jgi:hypothetical protein
MHELQISVDEMALQNRLAIHAAFSAIGAGRN